MTARPVSTYVNNVKNQGEQCVVAPEQSLWRLDSAGGYNATHTSASACR
jgi:hypothetical protein